MQNHRYLVKMDFQGTAFSGWQMQPNAKTIQGELTRTLSLILDEKIALTGAGRTDAGVHAKNYVAHFDSTQKLTPDEAQKLLGHWNNFLPKGIAIQKIVRSPKPVHARFDAIWREYQYFLQTQKDAFAHPFSYRLMQPLDWKKMNLAAAILKEYQDFTSFSKVHTNVSNFICTVHHALWKETAQGLTFTIRANRFLRNMVRAIVGTLLEVGLNQKSVADFEKVIEQKSRTAAGISVPAQGLFLTKILYDNPTNDLLEIE